MSLHCLDEELLDPERFTALQQTKLMRVIQGIRAAGPQHFYAQQASSASIDLLVDRFEEWPITTRADLERDQRTHPPFGSTPTLPVSQYTRYHQTSGTAGEPLRWIDTPRDWDWWKKCWAMVFRGAGLQSDDRIVFPFSFGPFVGFWAAFETSVMLGNLSLPAGGMTTSARLRYILDNAVTVICCTPTYAMRLVQAAERDGVSLVDSAVRLLIVAGEPGGGVAWVRSILEAAFGARIIDHAGMTEMGPWGFECEESPGGMHIAENEFIAEVIDPVDGKKVADGQQGELVLTNLGRIGNPLMRYRTGDIVSLRRSQCRCGRWFARAEGGILGRSDSMIFVRGNNVFPSAIENIVREFSGLSEWRIVLEESGGMRAIRIEVEKTSTVEPEALSNSIASAIQHRLHFRADVVVVPANSLPRSDMKSRRVFINP